MRIYNKKPKDNIELKREEELIETIKDVFTRNGVKQKSEGRIVTYFTPDSATDFVEDLTKTLIHLKDDNKIRRVFSDKNKGFEKFANDWLHKLGKTNRSWLWDKYQEYLKKENKDD